MPENHYDIIIIGGGLAGLSQAILAARKNYKVLLIEKENYPFHKVCGEYISNESLPFLQSIGLDTNAMKLPAINRFMLSLPNGQSLETKLVLGGFGISRYTLDFILYNEALNSGAEIITDLKVSDVSFEENRFRVSASDKIFHARIVTGSYGKRSNLDIKQRLDAQKKSSFWNKNYIGVKYHIEYNTEKNLIALHHFKQGYCGISAIESGKSCLCYLTTAENLQQAGNNIKALELKELYKNPYLKDIFTQAKFLYDQPLTIAQVNFEPRQVVENHIIRCGDAAGLITPLCGNGMSMALHSSKIAFEFIQNFLGNKISRQQMETDYTKAWNNKFNNRIKSGRIIQRLSENNFNLKLLFYSMKKFNFISNAVIKSTHGEVF